ncbi:uncharacterized protein LOC126267447 [Schistocerca gregaria]|uniref:uncharacterized protein LOC126267447 n=1 Tax=Schistocerca gregaria TaxID=7010 RepID=UPI00211F302A|nr:uncharacterized protein LOC126267447 [Schistocerca gregaria]
MARTCGMLFGLMVALVMTHVTSGAVLSALPYQDETRILHEPIRTLVLNVANLLVDLGVTLSMAIVTAIKFVILLLHAIGSALGRELELSGSIKDLERVSATIQGSSPPEAKTILQVLEHKITELLRCIFATLRQLLVSVLHPQFFPPAQRRGLLALAHDALS